ncbi:hypothetical protein NUACC21_55990 [Scytonema sp. NUACC21]
MKSGQDSRLLQLVCHFLKYFLLALFGFAIAYVLSITFGIGSFSILVIEFVTFCISRLGLLLLCLMATTVVFESLR